MLMRSDPFQELDRLSRQLLSGAAARPASMPMDAFREGDVLVLQLDLPGIDPQALELTAEKNILTIQAERRRPTHPENDHLVAERPWGRFTRQVFMGEALDLQHIEANYDAGVLTVRIPVAEKAKPRRIDVQTGASQPASIEATSHEDEGAAAVGS